MPQSLSRVIIHIIFTTKDREAWLDRDVRPRMHAYVATKSTIAPIVFKRSIATFCANAALNSTNPMCGIEANASFDSRFQRSLLGEFFPGALPQARMDPRPWRYTDT